MELVRRFEGSNVRIVALTIASDSSDCALIRFLLSDPEAGREILERAGLAIVETDLIAVELPRLASAVASHLHRVIASRGEHRPDLPALARPPLSPGGCDNGR